MAKSILDKDENAADALQETILKAYQSIHALREPKFFKTWIFRILINQCNTILAGCFAYRSLLTGSPCRFPFTVKNTF
ncbi:hypothetical protein NI000_09170 [Paenibacillus tyrfis]|nr:hypothetical protein [Paenibacillus tyrfis]